MSATRSGDGNFYIDGFPITPSDTVDLDDITLAIYVGSDGDVTVETLGGKNVTFKSVRSGTTLKIRATKILSSNTTANNLVGLI